MTPKEKAEELIEKFSEYCAVTSETVSLSRSKQCALIAVEEIENALTEYGKQSYELQNMDSEWRYWQHVKQEIERL